MSSNFPAVFMASVAAGQLLEPMSRLVQELFKKHETQISKEESDRRIVEDLAKASF